MEQQENYKEEEEEEDIIEKNANLMCRFYRKDFPDEGELVITEVTKVHENGAYVDLLEYERLEGLILPTEVTKKRVKSVNKFIKVGKKETMMVIRVDKEKRYIDLSKKKVQPEEAAEKEDFFKKAKIVHNIMKQVAQKLKVKLIDLYEQFGWDLYDKFDHALDAFQLLMSSEPDRVFDKIPQMKPDQKQALLEAISKKMAPQPVKIRSDIELTCMTSEGIDGIKDSLLEGRNSVYNENFQLQFKIIAPPLYKCEIVTLDKKHAIQQIESALQVVEKTIKSKGGTFKLIAKSRVIGAHDMIDIDDIKEKYENQDDEYESEDNDEGINVDLEEEEENKHSDKAN